MTGAAPAPSPTEPQEEKEGFQFPSTMTVLVLVTLLVWIAAFLIPSGTYQHDQDGVPQPGSYERIDAPQDFGERAGDFFLAPVNGLYGLQSPETGVVEPFGEGTLFGAVGVFAFVLAIGAFMTMVLATGALDVAIGRLAYAVRGRPWLVIVAVMALFSLLGTTMGWADETLGFYALIIPLMLTLGYDRMTVAGTIIAGATVGAMASTVNPFSIGVASEFADIGIADGLGLRWIGWFVLTAIAIAYVVRYAQRVKADPDRSLVGFSADDRAEVAKEQSSAGLTLTGRQKLVLAITAFTFALLIFSVIPWDSILDLQEKVDPYTHEPIDGELWWNLGWWFPELTALFLVAAVVVGLVAGYGESEITGNITRGLRDFLGAAIAVVLARGVTVILNNTQTIDTLLHWMEDAVSGTDVAVFTSLVALINTGIAFIIPSSSGHATLAMPLLAPLGDFADVSRSLVVTAWSWGAGLARFITPTSAVVMAGIALAGVRYDRWIRFMLPLMGLLAVASIAIVAVGVAVSLWATGVLDLEQALAGFGDPTVIFIASLFVVSEALDATGVTTWAGQALIARSGESRTRVLVLTMLLCAGLTALITVNGSVAALVPVMVVLAIRLGRQPSQMMMPLAFAGHAGSLLVLTASPVNVIVSDAASDTGVGPIGFFDFAILGVPLLAGTIAIVVLFGERLLPHRTPRAMAPDFGDHARTLVHQYGLDDPREVLNRSSGAAEVVIPPRSGLVGEVAYPGMVTESGDLVVLAVQRMGEELPGETVLAVGDTLLLQGAWSALDEHLGDPDVTVVDLPELVRRHAVPLGPGAKRALVALAAMVALIASGATPPAVAGLLAAGALVVSGVLSTEQAYRGIGWTTVILVAGMIPLSTAMIETGAAERLATGLVDVVGDAGPRVLLLGLVLLVLALGQLISNMATALIVIPIAVSAAQYAGVSPKPMLVGVAVAAAAAFLTPVATPANLMVMEPGGYRFRDYWKLGLPLLALFGAVAVLLVPVFWAF